MRRFFSFWWLCARNAFWGNAAFANDWQWLLGYPVLAVLLWIIGYFYAELSGSIQVTLTTGALGALAAAFAAYIITWLASFVVRLLNQPVILFHEQRDRADKLEGLRQLANDATKPPSFAIGFEHYPFNKEQFPGFAETITEEDGARLWVSTQLSIADTQDVCRIWVENLEHQSIVDCRLVLEDFRPDSPVKNGVMLLPDNRGSDEEKSAKFHLAVTEKLYFKFLVLGKRMLSNHLAVSIKSDQDRTSFSSFHDNTDLEFGKTYFATIAVHGKGAVSRRINLTIDVVSTAEIVVTTSETKKVDPLSRLVSKRERFTIAEAACLLAQTDIKQDDLVGPASGYLYDIKTGISAGTIKPLNMTNLEVTLARIGKSGLGFELPSEDIRNTVEISKDALLKLAEKNGIEIPGLSKSTRKI